MGERQDSFERDDLNTASEDWKRCVHEVEEEAERERTD